MPYSAMETSTPHFPSEAVFTAKHFQLLQHFKQIKVSEENGQPSARTKGSDAFQGANIAHPTPSNLCGGVGTAWNAPGPPGERGGKANEGRQTSGPAHRAVGTQLPRSPRNAAPRDRSALAAEAHTWRNEFFRTTWKTVPLAAL